MKFENRLNPLPVSFRSHRTESGSGAEQIPVIWALVVILAIVGCGRQSLSEKTPAEAAVAKPASLEDAELARASGDLERAWSLGREVLITNPNDPKALTVLAQIAFESGRKQEAADFLVESARAHNLGHPHEVQRAVLGLFAVGRVFDAQTLLHDAVKKHPDEHGLRRSLFDLLMGSGNDRNALPHAQYLIRARKIDFPLLMAIVNTDEHIFETDSMKEMVRRWPNDNRPLLAEAKRLVVNRDYTAAKPLVDNIIGRHPDYVPAQILCGQILIELGKFNEIAAWSANLQGDYEDDWRYWIILGDCARQARKTAPAVRAYWESTRRSCDHREAWMHLSGALSELRVADKAIDENKPWIPEAIKAIEDRIRKLTYLQEVTNRFEPSSAKSRAQIVEVAKTLFELGRPWEAEAWAAMGLASAGATMPDLTSERNKILAELHVTADWQSVDKQDALQIDCTDFPLQSFSDPEIAADEPLQNFRQSAIPVLINEAEQRGLSFFGKTRDHLDKADIPFYATLGCGGAAIDFDLNGWTDVALAAAGGAPLKKDSVSNALFQNREGYFVEVTRAADANDFAFGQGIAVGDLNEDGWPDLLYLNYGSNSALINQGDGTFINRSSTVFQNLPPRWSTSGALADFDGDGLTDIMVVNYCVGIKPVTERCLEPTTKIARACSPTTFAAESDFILKSMGDGTFHDVTAAWGAVPISNGRGLGIIVGSLDNTGGLDALITNDMSYNHFYRFENGANPKANESALLRGLAGDARGNPQGSMGIAVADFNRDGRPDFYVSNFEREYNTFYEQVRDGIWQDKTVMLGLAPETFPLVGFGTQAIDFDNDGRSELIVSNGHIDFPAPGLDVDYFQPMQIFGLSSATQFQLLKHASPNVYLDAAHVGRALFSMDANNDGQLDVVVTHQTEPVALLINRTPTRNCWIGFQLHGTVSARDAVGAVVKVRSDKFEQTLGVFSGNGFLCSNERVLRFGLDESIHRVDVEIVWPNASVQRLENLQTKQVYNLVQNEPNH